jgi:hypothetical protein
MAVKARPNARKKVVSEKMIRVPFETWGKIKFMADMDRRILGVEMDILIDEALQHRGIDPDAIDLQEYLSA